MGRMKKYTRRGNRGQKARARTAKAQKRAITPAKKKKKTKTPTVKKQSLVKKVLSGGNIPKEYKGKPIIGASPFAAISGAGKAAPLIKGLGRYLTKGGLAKASKDISSVLKYPRARQNIPKIAGAAGLGGAGAVLVGGGEILEEIEKAETQKQITGDTMGKRRYAIGEDITPTYHGEYSKQWTANGVIFQRNEDGTISVQKKDGTVKTYRPYKPIVFGKRPDGAKLARVIKKHRGVYKELHKVFGTKTRRVKS